MKLTLIWCLYFVVILIGFFTCIQLLTAAYLLLCTARQPPSQCNERACPVITLLILYGPHVRNYEVFVPFLFAWLTRTNTSDLLL